FAFVGFAEVDMGVSSNRGGQSGVGDPEVPLAEVSVDHQDWNRYRGAASVADEGQAVGRIVDDDGGEGSVGLHVIGEIADAESAGAAGIIVHTDLAGQIHGAGKTWAWDGHELDGTGNRNDRQGRAVGGVVGGGDDGFNERVDASPRHVQDLP